MSHHPGPNILLILSDDQGAWALGCSGNTEIQTPHLDNLASGGTRLDNFFCVSPVCSPARASLMTGTIPSKHGVHDYLHGVETGPEAPDYLQGQRLFTDDLAAAGYYMGLSGKWHLGANDRAREGFSHWFSLAGGGSPYDAATMYRNGVKETVYGYLTDAITADSTGFMERAAGQDSPFFLALNYTAPHKPWKDQHPAEFTALYDDCAFESCPQEPTHPWTPTVDGVPIGGEADVRAALVGYFAAVSAMDAGIGQVLQKLDELGLREDTLVIFSSDNGFNCGQHGVWGKGNGTFPLNVFDSSIKVPAIFSFPGRIARGKVREELLSAYDLPATILELAGLDPLEFEQGPGKSFADVLRGKPLAPARPRPVVVFDEYGPVRMIRSDSWKYVHRYPQGPHELYDLATDPGERHNLVREVRHEERVAGMRRDMQLWFEQYQEEEADGRKFPVVGAGQTLPVRADPLGAFTPPSWDGISTAGGR
ncbi:sulfatase [Arthrobacter sp. FB24]|uniref:sulfatase-like hydrolase/transferase n=1 Tax=Arthrobacter sp. (strain FB24) TaxID=290399 RepID=UPI00005269FA|nr:sulfatase-like hydrolase/transferase [Arthrobacter sp. FB24]ABK03094.1 sulfatase [Arthrobacter sp. FB24]